MRLSPPLRKGLLALHLVCSVGWIGAILAYLAIDVAAMSADPQTSRTAWTAMALVGNDVLIPLAIGSLVTGVAIALATPWGLFRHYWVVISLILTTFATIVLVAHMPDVNAASAGAGAATGTHGGEHGTGRGDLLHAGGGLAVLLFVAVLNVYKPRGLTRHGWSQRVNAPPSV